IVVSPRLGHDLEGVCNSDIAPWEVVGNILDNIFLEKDCISYGTTRGKGRFSFLNVAGLRKIKGHNALLQAFALKFAGRKEIRLRVAGDGDLRHELAILSGKLGIDDQVDFLGYIDRQGILEQMCACDAYVHSSSYETFGVAIIEALACGRPVVSTACGGPEYVVNSKNGVLVPVGNIHALADAMENMVFDAGNYDRKQIREDCIMRFGEQAIVDRLSAIYRKVIEGPSG
ncbi:MAG: glycosyltransferase, partial [Nitrospirota bacterium]